MYEEEKMDGIIIPLNQFLPAVFINTSSCTGTLYRYGGSIIVDILGYKIIDNMDYY